jgi:hypothetical protein
MALAKREWHSAAVAQTSAAKYRRQRLVATDRTEMWRGRLTIVGASAQIAEREQQSAQRRLAGSKPE